jgi:hypothetical protein
MATSLPTVWEAFRRGDIDADQMLVIDRVARRVTETATLAAIDEQAVDAADTRSPKQLRVWLLRLVVQLEPLRLSSFLCKRLLILLGWGSSAVDCVPVLAAVKLGRPGRVGGRVDRGCAPAGLAGMEEPRGARPPAGHKVTSSRPGNARLSAP